MKNTKRVLWLDDIRNPNSQPWKYWIESRCGVDIEIYWASTYNEFVNYINTTLPNYICFDHDLGEDEDGMDCMKYLINYMLDNNISANDIIVYSQSANPVGRDNMLMMYNNFKKAQ
jgi:hypothetical protein